MKPKIANFPAEKWDDQPKGSALVKQHSHNEQRLGEQRWREEERRGQRSRGGMKGGEKKCKGKIKWMNVRRGVKRGRKGWLREHWRGTNVKSRGEGECV